MAKIGKVYTKSGTDKALSATSGGQPNTVLNSMDVEAGTYVIIAEYQFKQGLPSGVSSYTVQAQLGYGASARLGKAKMFINIDYAVATCVSWIATFSATTTVKAYAGSSVAVGAYNGADMVAVRIK